MFSPAIPGIVTGQGLLERDACPTGNQSSSPGCERGGRAVLSRSEISTVRELCLSVFAYLCEVV